MTPAEAATIYSNLSDGQAISISLSSGRSFQGIYDGAQTDPQTFLYFETYDNRELRAEWANISDIAAQGGRRGVTGQPMNVPPEHPLAAPDGRLKPYTTRNRF